MEITALPNGHHADGLGGLGHDRVVRQRRRARSPRLHGLSQHLGQRSFADALGLGEPAAARSGEVDRLHQNGCERGFRALGSYRKASPCLSGSPASCAMRRAVKSSQLLTWSGGTTIFTPAHCLFVSSLNLTMRVDPAAMTAFDGFDEHDLNIERRCGLTHGLRG